MVERPTVPGCQLSESSRNSCLERVRISSAMRARVAVRIAIETRSSLSRSLATCHPIEGTPKPHLLQNDSRSVNPLSSKTDKVPQAPKSWPTNMRLSPSRIRSSRRCNSSYHEATLRPKVIGRAGWAWVRPVYSECLCSWASVLNLPLMCIRSTWACSITSLSAIICPVS